MQYSPHILSIEFECIYRSQHLATVYSTGDSLEGGSGFCVCLYMDMCDLVVGIEIQLTTRGVWYIELRAKYLGCSRPISENYHDYYVVNSNVDNSKLIDIKAEDARTDEEKYIDINKIDTKQVLYTVFFKYI